MRKYKATNIFAINNPHEFDCNIENFVIGHSELQFQAANKQGGWYSFVFVGVEYLSGPIRWRGCNIDILSDETCIKLLQSIHIRTIPNSSINLASTMYKLYEIGSESTKIQILALDVSKLENTEI